MMNQGTGVAPASWPAVARASWSTLASTSSHDIWQRILQLSLKEQG